MSKQNRVFFVKTCQYLQKPFQVQNTRLYRFRYHYIQQMNWSNTSLGLFLCVTLLPCQTTATHCQVQPCDSSLHSSRSAVKANRLLQNLKRLTVNLLLGLHRFRFACGVNLVYSMVHLFHFILNMCMTTFRFLINFGMVYFVLETGFCVIFFFHSGYT